MESYAEHNAVEVVKENLLKGDYTEENVIMLGYPDEASVLHSLKVNNNAELTWSEWELCVKKGIGLHRLRVESEQESEYYTVGHNPQKLNLNSKKVFHYWDQYAEAAEADLGQESLQEIWGSCRNTLKWTAYEYPTPIKGLVHGSVQSGKTANMEGLISLAADYGFNIFIVFTGNIISLNNQTSDRFEEDLLQGEYSFTFVDTDEDGMRAPNHRTKTVCVSMKTNKRIARIIRWLTSKPQDADKYHIMVIDDEADLASINTAKQDRDPSRTNNLLRLLVNGKKLDGAPIDKPYASMNYIAYTATPYANLLNEETEESLYPRSFITSIPTSNRYFGPQQIFGVTTDATSYRGLPVYISSSDLDTEYIRFEKNHGDLPEDMKESIAWFISAVAALRYRGYKKPLTLMINTSPKIDSHQTVGHAVLNYINRERSATGELRKYCEIIYNRECKRFSKELLKELMPNYYGEEYSVHEASIITFPSFEEIVPELDKLLNNDCQTNETDEDSKYIFTDKLQICMENSNDSWINREDNDMEIHINRVKYPENDQTCETAPAFIVIGGNILSRGLTLKGLISTYFARPIKQADTLMQMGRWFGYRKYYELFPRIWLSNATVRDYQYLARLDEKLKEEIALCNSQKKTPEQCAIRLLAIPDGQRLRGELRRLSANNKTKKQRPASISYVGKYEEFATFKKDYNQLTQNLSLTKKFLCELSSKGIEPELPPESERSGWNVIRWRNVPTSILYDDFVSKFNYGAKNNNELDEYDFFKKWLENLKGGKILPRWTVMVAGTVTDNDEDKFEINESLKIGKIVRGNNSAAPKGTIDIKTLRSKADLFKDEFPSEFDNPYLLKAIKQGEFTRDLRKEQRQYEGLENPLLLIYCIDKDSKPRDNAKQTVPLDVEQDVIAFLVEVPDSDDDNSDMVAIDLDRIHLGEEEDVNQ